MTVTRKRTSRELTRDRANDVLEMLPPDDAETIRAWVEDETADARAQGERSRLSRVIAAGASSDTGSALIFGCVLGVVGTLLLMWLPPVEDQSEVPALTDSPKLLENDGADP